MRRWFIAGVLVVVPIIITWLVLSFLFNAIDGILQPLILKLSGRSIPGLGILTTIIIILVVGSVARNFFGSRLIKLGDSVLAKMPFIRPVYSSAKQLLEAIALPSANSFKDVVMIEYPRKEVWAIGFVSNRIQVDRGDGKSEMVSVFIPSTPTPMSGMVVVVPERDVLVLDMTVEEGIKFVVSGGVASPRQLTSVSRLRPSGV
ncbi:MAG: DUF502 domain-containing protein [Candidatus Zixiibacteriota bacterium]